MPNAPTAALPERFSLAYVPALDGIRGLAILMVVGFHAGWPAFRGGFIGVDVFFVLSGFLITSLLLQEWDVSHRINLKAFYIRRALRLAPALIAALILTNLLIAALVPGIGPDARHDTLYVLTYGFNWAIVAGAIRTHYFDQTWSLAVEEQFYILFPWMLGRLLRGLRRRHILLILVGGSLLSWLLRWQRVTTALVMADYYVRTDSRLDTLLMGGALAVLLSMRARLKAPRFAGLAALGSLLIFAIMGDFGAWLTYCVGLSIVGLATVLLVGALVTGESRLKRALSWGPLVRVGRLSYSWYLWHWMIQQLILSAAPQTPVQIAGTIGASVGLGLSMLSYRHIEAPFLRLKDKGRKLV